MSEIPDRPDLAVLRIGDVVRRGRGKATWKIRGFWLSPQREPMADLMPLDGYTSASAHVRDLTLVDPTERRLP